MKTLLEGTHAPSEAFFSKARLMMKYRNIEYTVVQGIERGVWKWTASVDGVLIMGQAAIKSESLSGIMMFFDRAFAA